MLRLPAPPPTKRRRVLAPVPCTDGVGDDEAPQTAEEPHQAQLSEEDDDLADANAPNDTLAALLLLKTRFPASAQVPPFATKAQLYSVLSDRTLADRQLEALRRRGELRLLQLPAAAGGAARPDDCALVLAADYRAAALQQGDQGDAEASAALQWFVDSVLPACTDLLITHGELGRLLQPQPSPPVVPTPLPGGGAASRPEAARAAAGAPSHHNQPQQPPAAAAAAALEGRVSLLLNRGVLTRHPVDSRTYLFGLPGAGAGAAVRSVAAGRAELRSLLQRRRHPEQLEAELVRRKLQRSTLGVGWHLADMVGSGALLRVATTVGPLLRLAPRCG